MYAMYCINHVYREHHTIKCFVKYLFGKFKLIFFSREPVALYHVKIETHQHKHVRVGDRHLRE